MGFRLRFSLLCLCLLAPQLLADSTRNLDMKSFQTVWETIRDKHWDLNGTGVDWEQIYKDYLPKAEQATSRSAMRAVIREMIGELGQSHFNILGEASSAAMKEIEAITPSGNARPGFSVAIVDGRVFVVKVDTGSSASKSDVAIGQEILSLNGQTMASILKKMRKAYGQSAHAELYMQRSLNQMFYGRTGKKIKLQVQQNSQKKKLSVALEKPKGRFINLLNLPATYYQYDSEVLVDGIGYIHFNIWVPNAKQAFEKESLPAMVNTQGIIIDLRGNGGGLGILAISLANKLVNQKNKKLGTMRNSGTEMNFPIFPQKPVYTGPVAILIDAGSASTSEIFAAGLQDLGRARVFGVRSAGATLPSLIEELPNGDLFQYAMADYTSSSGRTLEGAGVIPDQQTPHTLESLSRGEDASLLAARRWIKAQSQKGAQND